MSKNELAVAMVVGHETAVKLFEEDEFDTIFSQIQKMVAAQEADTSTASGRDEIRGLAAKITRTKTAITGMGKDLTEDWRKKTAKVNEKRGEFESRLKALAATARKPLDDWEAAEEKRKADMAEGMQKINTLQTLTFDVSSATIKYNLAELEKLMSDFDFQESQDTADVMADAAKVTLETALKQVEAREATEAEYARLQAERAEADRLAAEKAAADEKARLADQAARDAEQARRDKEASDNLAKQQAEFDALKAKSDAELAAARAKTQEAENARLAAIEEARLKELEAADNIEREKKRADDAETAKLQAIEDEKTARLQAMRQSPAPADDGPQIYVGTSTPVDDGDPVSKDEFKTVKDAIEAALIDAAFDDGCGGFNADAMINQVSLALAARICNGEIPHVSVDF